jgi:hypothetical protein
MNALECATPQASGTNSAAAPAPAVRKFYLTMPGIRAPVVSIATSSKHDATGAGSFAEA